MDTGNATVALNPVILIIAGTDSSGGAGIARDIETATNFGVATALAVTAITAQTHNKVLQIGSVSTKLITEQITSAFASNTIGAVKIGMSRTVRAIKAISTTLKKHCAAPIIFDPILESSSKGKLFYGNMREAIVNELLPAVTLITPNLLELAQLTLCKKAQDEKQAIEQGKHLIRLGSHAVLVKGGHAKGKRATDYLLKNDLTLACFSQKRINNTMRGTGCILSTAIAASLALGLPLDDAIREAKQHVFYLLKRKIQRPISLLEKSSV